MHSHRLYSYTFVISSYIQWKWGEWRPFWNKKWLPRKLVSKVCVSLPVQIIFYASPTRICQEGQPFWRATDMHSNWPWFKIQNGGQETQATINTVVLLECLISKVCVSLPVKLLCLAYRTIYIINMSIMAAILKSKMAARRKYQHLIQW